MNQKKLKTTVNLIIIVAVIFCATVLSILIFSPPKSAFAIENQQENTTVEKVNTSSSTLSNGGSVAENKDDIGIQLDSSNKNNLSSINCIENKNYFLRNPLHGKNDVSLNPVGTCSTVAVQLLLGYHNYYSDRRLIPETGDNGVRYLNENYGSFQSNPIHYNGTPYINSAVEKQLGDPEIGTENEFYLKLLSYTSNDQNLFSVVSGANEFIDQYSPIASRVSLKSYLFFKFADGQAEIDAGRPIVLGYEPVFTGAKNYHVVIAFGYASYNGELGFLVHSGWTSEKLVYWVPSSWIGFHVTMEINHNHGNVMEDKTNEPTHSESGGYVKFNCSECGYSKYDELFEFNSSGNIITGLRYPKKKAITIPAKFKENYIREIGEEAFSGSEMLYVYSEDYTILTKIGVGAFRNCKKLLLLRIPDNVAEIPDYAFDGCNAMSFTYFGTALKKIGYAACRNTNQTFGIPASVTEIADYAYYNAGLPDYFSLPANSQLTTIGLQSLANNPSIETLILPTTVTSIGFGAFSGNKVLTFYTEHDSKPSGWNNMWNSLNRPVIWNCNLSVDNTEVNYFMKTNSNPSNKNAVNGISAPSSVFDGWYTTPDFTGEQYMDLKNAPNGVLYAKKKEPACVAEGSLITLADGTQKAVEDLTGSEQLLVWNLFTGKFDTAPILFIDSDPASEYEVIDLIFSDGTIVKVIDEHAFWDFNLNKYVFLRSDAAKYILHWFHKQTTDANGNMTYTRVQLTDVNVRTEYTTAWSPVTYRHLCYYVNGMLSMPGATTGLINLFEVDSDTMKIDETKYNADIAKYGLFTYEEFAAIYPVPETIFEAFGGKYLKVAMGKGLLTEDMLAELLERYSKFFEIEEENPAKSGKDIKGNHFGHANGNNGNHYGHLKGKNLKC